VIVVLPDVFPLEDDAPAVDVEAPVTLDVAPVVMEFEPPVEVDAPVDIAPTEPPAPPWDVEAPVVETEFEIGVLVIAPPEVPPSVSMET
jgi:hypothetical protein